MVNPLTFWPGLGRDRNCYACGVLLFVLGWWDGGVGRGHCRRIQFGLDLFERLLLICRQFTVFEDASGAIAVESREL
jgi:hypothetical protein